MYFICWTVHQQTHSSPDVYLCEKGRKYSYILSTLNETCEISTMTVNVHVSSLDGTEHMRPNKTIVVDCIPCDPQLPMKTQSYPHLLNLPIVEMVNDLTVGIGHDNLQALIPINITRGKPRDPYAVRTIFDLSLHGVSKQILPACKRVIANFVTSIEGRVSKLWCNEGQHIGTNRKGLVSGG